MPGDIFNIEMQRSLTNRDFAILTAEIGLRRKHAPLAYALCILLGWIGVHKFYLDQRKAGAIYSIMGFLGWPLLLRGLPSTFRGVPSGWETIAFICGTIFIAVLAIMLLRDLYSLQQQVESANEQIKIDLLCKLTGGQ